MAGLRVPLSTLRLRPYGRRRMTRGQDDWLGLSCTTLAFATLCRFLTAHYASYQPHLEGHGTIPSDRCVGGEGASSWRNAVASGVTPPGRGSGGGRSGSSGKAGCPSATSAGASS